MAEVTALRNNLSFPLYAAPWGVVFPILDADGDLVTGAAGLDSEISQNGDTFADCTNEATEIGSSGMYYLLLTTAEMTSNVVTIIVKTSTVGAKTTPMVFYPRILYVTVSSGTSQGVGGGGASNIQLAAGESALDDVYSGMVIGALIDGAVQIRTITNYVGSTKLCTVTPDFTINPDSDDTYQIILPDGVTQLQQANTTVLNGSATAAANLSHSALSIYYGTVGSGTATTIVDTGLTESATDHWKGRIVIFITGSLAKQATDITGFDPATDTLTVTSLTGSPSGGDTYVIV